MALFQGNTRVEGSRSNTALVKSGHASPAENWLLDPKFKAANMSAAFVNGALFSYQYGGAGMEDVVIPKGRMVGVGSPVKDFVSKKMKTVITLPGLANGGNSIGMAPYNFAADLLQIDRLGGNAPSIITQDYVTLPYIPTVEADARYTVAGILAEEAALSTALKMPWGAVIGAGLMEGDFLKATPSGRLCKWIPKSWTVATDVVTVVGDDESLRVGQILASDFNQEQFGWLKWMLWNESDVQSDDTLMNRSGSSSLPSDGGYPFDPAYRDGNNIFQFMQTSTINAPTGIPGLHDGNGDYTGYGKNDTEYTARPLGAFPSTLVLGVATGTGETAKTAVENTKAIEFQALDFAGGKLTNLVNPVLGFKVFVGGVLITDLTRIAVNYKTGVISVKPIIGNESGAITATYMAMHFGTSTYLDFKGVVGSFNVLLMK